jgi:hypothetical protein
MTAQPKKIEAGTLHASMALAFAERVETRSALDFVRAKDGATGVMWLPLPADPFIFVSEDGELVSLHHRPGRILKTSPSGEYQGVKIAGITRHIHRLVCETFYGPRPDMVVRHLDGDRRNNRLGNLVWGTHGENSEDQRRHGTRMYGERNPMARLTRASVNQMRELRASGRTFKSIAKQFGVSAMTAHRAITGGSWK